MTMKATHSDVSDIEAEWLKMKLALSRRIADALVEQNYTQAAAAELIGLPQPKISAIVRGKLEGVSVSKLLRCLMALGHEVTVSVKTAPKGKRASVRASFAGKLAPTIGANDVHR